jgi:hypothetical protein
MNRSFSLAPHKVLARTETFDISTFLHAYRSATVNREKTASPQQFVSSLIDTAMPLIQSELKRFGPVSYDLQDEMIQAAAESIWKAFDKGEIDIEGSNVESWLRCRLRWRMKNVVSRSQPRIFDLQRRGVRFSDLVGQMPTPIEAENRIFQQQLRRLAIEAVRKNLRFSPAKNRACLEIAERLVEGEEVDLGEIAKQFKVDKVRFLFGFVKLHMRSYLWPYRHRRPSALDPDTDWIRKAF